MELMLALILLEDEIPEERCSDGHEESVRQCKAEA